LKDLEKVKDVEPEEADKEKKELIDNLLQEYHDLDYEDVIAGGNLKTRFKYASVEEKHYGLDDEELLLLDDDQLNRMVSLKKI